MNLTTDDIRILSCLSTVPQPIRVISQTVAMLSYKVRDRIFELKQAYPELGLRLGERIACAQGRPRGYTMRPAPDVKQHIEDRYLQWEEQDHAEATRKRMCA